MTSTRSRRRPSKVPSGFGLATVIVLTVAVGCGRDNYDQRGGPAIAEAVRALNSPIVEEVAYRPGTTLDAARIDIIVGSNANAEALTELMCSQVRPLLQRGDPPESMTVLAWREGSDRILRVDTDPCP
jgi:hypothetical protein